MGICSNKLSNTKIIIMLRFIVKEKTQYKTIAIKKAQDYRNHERDLALGRS